MRGKVIALEGQIGAGKTTLGLRLSEIFALPFHGEVVSETTERLLRRFYADKRRWAFTTQTHFIIRRATAVRTAEPSTGGVLDRSLYGDRIFAEMLHDDGYMRDEEFATYGELFDLLSGSVRPPDVMLFLDCSVEVAMARIRTRNRPGEARIDREYLEHLDRRYRAWFEGYDQSAKLRLPYDDFSIDDPQAMEELIDRLQDAVSKAE